MNRSTRQPAQFVPSNISRLLERGIAFHRAQDLKAAAGCYRQVLELDPNQADALHLLGTIAGQRKRYGEAVRLIEAAIRIRPGEAIFRNNLGNALLATNEPHLAVKQLKEAVRLNPKYVEAMCNLGKAYESCGQIDEAREIFRKAATLDPTYDRARLSLARAEQYGGEPKQAIQELRKFLEKNPHDYRAICGLLMSDMVTPDMPELSVAETILRDPNLPTAVRASLMHTLGKAYNDIGRYEEAISLVIEAKKLENQSYDMDKRRAWSRATREIFDSEYFSKRQGYGIDSQLPVFIVGMPRSGTTLTEQILASHPQAEGAGELPHIGRIASIIGATGTKAEVDAARLRAVTPEKIAELAGAYIDRLRQDTSTALRITDKAPLNLRYLGVISLLFPRAKIVHCTRDPLDTCVSIFMQRFNVGHYYSYDLKTLGQYYRDCDELMVHWKRVIPQEILELNYETLVSDFETQARRLIDFIGLEWDDACLNFQQTKRTVATASKWQVRQPVYKTSVERWRRYEKYLGPLIEGLGLSAAV